MNKKVILLILDGWGEAPSDRFNAIKNANTPTMDRLKEQYPWMLLKADGESVGLMQGQMGTSEVNHLAIGTGRIIWQDLPKLNKMVRDKSFHSNEAIVNVINHVKTIIPGFILPALLVMEEFILISNTYLHYWKHVSNKA